MQIASFDCSDYYDKCNTLVEYELIKEAFTIYFSMIITIIVTSFVLGKDDIMDLSFLKVLMPMLLDGLKITLEVSMFGIFFGFLIGCLSGFALQCKNKITKVIANIYLWIIRGTPLIVQALYVYFVIPKITGHDIQSNAAGIIVISLNSGAFIAEIVRGSLEGIDLGQKEAGVSLGLTPFQTLWHVVIPPAFKSMLPALFNQFIITVKDTAILSVIVVNEITKQIQNYAAVTFDTIQAYSAGAVFYLMIISILIIIQKQIERRVKA